MKCPKCDYEWNTKSTKMFVTCPNCLSKIKLPNAQSLGDSLRKNAVEKKNSPASPEVQSWYSQEGDREENRL